MTSHYLIVRTCTQICPFLEKANHNKKKHSDYNYNVEFINSIKNYLTKKELYGAYRKRAFGRSRDFK
jgi:DNA-dependent RNA polymerase auxiliary subunit epsilon